jgi:putative Holliday junction resolvase
LPARILAIDFGLRRIGLAISDALGVTAQGLPTLQRTSIRKDIEHIRTMAEDYSAEKVIVGNPIGHTGKATSMSRHAEDFAKKLQGRLNCPVELWDERLTSVEANRMLKTAGLSINKRQQAVDRVSAVLLLQNYLDHHANQLERADASGGNLG